MKVLSTDFCTGPGCGAENLGLYYFVDNLSLEKIELAPMGTTHHRIEHSSKAIDIF